METIEKISKMSNNQLKNMFSKISLKNREKINEELYNLIINYSNLENELRNNSITSDLDLIYFLIDKHRNIIENCFMIIIIKKKIKSIINHYCNDISKEIRFLNNTFYTKEMYERILQNLKNLKNSVY